MSHLLCFEGEGGKNEAVENGNYKISEGVRTVDRTGRDSFGQSPEHRSSAHPWHDRSDAGSTVNTVWLTRAAVHWVGSHCKALDDW